MEKGPRLSALDNTGSDDRKGRGFVAVVGQWRQDAGKLPIPYAHAVGAAGGRPKVVSTFDTHLQEDVPVALEVLDGIDPLDAGCLEGAVGLVIPGGGDIDPAWYGRERHPKTENVNHRRDRFELTLLHEALARDMPILAICHGMQLLNVALGGTLEQHLPDSPQRLRHDRDRPRPDPAHGLRVKERSMLTAALGTSTTQVNSHHHQGLDDIAPQLEEIAWADDGVLEAVVSTQHSWVLGVQWHPEVMAPLVEEQLNIFKAFVDAARAYAAGGPEEVKARTA